MNLYLLETRLGPQHQHVWTLVGFPITHRSDSANKRLLSWGRLGAAGRVMTTAAEPAAAQRRAGLAHVSAAPRVIVSQRAASFNHSTLKREQNC